MKRVLIRVALLLLVCSGLALWSGCKPAVAKSDSGPTPSPAASVQIVRARAGEIARSITLPGEVAAYQQATLYAKVGGYLKTIRVDKGDRVKEGDVLAEIEVPEMIAELARYKAEVSVAKVDYERVADAWKKAPNLVTPQTVDSAKGKLEVAQAHLERIETLLKYAQIVAPFSGIITKRMVDPGAFIPAATSGSAAQNAAVVTLVDSSKVRVQVAIPESDVPFVSKGIPVTVFIEELPGREFKSEVTRDSHALDMATKTMLAEIELANPNSELRPGMYATVKLFVQKKDNALVVPASALTVEKAGVSVFGVIDGKAKKLPVKLGFNDGQNAEILQGLKEGDAVILTGKQSVADGQLVDVTEER